MDEIGHAIAGDPQEQKANVFKDFLTKPENLATALVLAAGFTSRRGPGQSKLNKALTSGVGALGFRGGLEKGVAGSRAQLLKDEDEAAESAAKISQGKRKNEIATETNRLRGEALITPTPQTESQIASDEALAALNNARAGNIGKAQPLKLTPTSFAELFQKNIALAREFLLPGQQMDLGLITKQTLDEQERLQLGEMGALRFENGVSGFDPDRVPQDRRKDFPNFFDSDGNPFGDVGIPTPKVTPTTSAKEPPSLQSELLQEAIGVGNRAFNIPSNVSRLRKARPEFEGQDEQTIANILADVVEQIRAGGFDKASVEDIQAIIDQYGPGLPVKDMRKLRRLIFSRVSRADHAKLNMRTFKTNN